MANAALYVRASTDLQKYSTANQRDVLLRYAQENGMTVVRTYEDDGCSGLRLKGRAGLRQLLSDVLSPEVPFEFLLVYDVSRWGRFQDLDESAHYEFVCRHAGAQLVYVAEPFDNDCSPLASLLKTIKRMMAAEYSRELSVKIIRGKRRIAQMGFAQTIPCLGLRRMIVDPEGNPKGILEPGQRKAIQSDRIVLVPGPRSEVALVRLIYRMFVEEELGYNPIAKILNARGFRTSRGNPWRKGAIKAVLSNEQYIGNLVFGKTTGKLYGKPVRTPPDTWVRCERAFQPIISNALFGKARVRREAPFYASDEECLTKLRELYERKGYLSHGLISAEPNMPGPGVYCWRFKKLTNAYKLVGFERPAPRGCVPPRKRKFTREYLLDRLSSLLEKRGFLTRRLIDLDPGTPHSYQYRTAFSSVLNAYALIGYDPSLHKAGPHHPRASYGRHCADSERTGGSSA